MARKPRIYVDGCPQHIIQRGNNRAACFYTHADYALYLNKLRKAAKANDVSVHAYVLMTNHVHLLASGANEFAIPNMMQNLGLNFVRYMNITYKRTGTLFEGRYKSSLVSTDRYFLTLSQYIELNPVRAGMVAAPGHYPWSSYRHNAMGIPIDLITEHDEYRNLGRTRAGRVKEYRRLFPDVQAHETLDEIRACTNKGWAIGNDKFRAEIASMLKRKVNDIPHGGDRKSHTYKENQGT